MEPAGTTALPTVTDSAGGSHLAVQLLDECRLMARHALASGLGVPGSVIQAVEVVSRRVSGEGLDQPGASGYTPLLRDPTPVELRRLALAHERLAQIVRPATPQTIAFMQRQSTLGGILGFLGPVPLVRQMMSAALVSIVAFVAISLSSQVSADPAAGDLLHSSGLPLLLNELFYLSAYLSAAGLGGSFAALFAANRYVANSSFDPKYNSSYWIRFVLGLLAGLILTTALPAQVSGTLRTVAKPALAMLGGFSATAVYRMIKQQVRLKADPTPLTGTC